MTTYRDIAEFITTYPRSHVNFCCGNSGTTALAKNLAISARNNNLPLTFFGLDETSVAEMQDYCDVVDATELGFSEAANIPTGRGVIKQGISLVGQPAFNFVSYARWEVVEALLNSGKTLTYLDVDIVINTNFESELLQQLKTKPDHILMQIETPSPNEPIRTLPNTGFFVVGPAWDKSVLLEFKPQQKLHDQDLFISLFNAGRTKVQLLDRDLYPNGCWYYDNHARIDKSCRLIHFNWVYGGTEKISKISEYGYWYDV